MSEFTQMKQLTTEEAKEFYDSGSWKTWTQEQIANFQMRQEKLCIPFDVFHAAVEKALGRSVWTHEFGLNYDGLLEELQGKRGAPTMQEIIALLPAEKTILIASSEEERDE